MIQDNPALETALKAGKLQFTRGINETLPLDPTRSVTWPNTPVPACSNSAWTNIFFRRTVKNRIEQYSINVKLV